MFGKLLMVKNACSEDNEVSLPHAVGEKLFFHQVKVWPQPLSGYPFLHC